MTIAHRHHRPLTFSAFVLVALGLPVVLPFSATIIGWVIRLPMRLDLADALLATLGVFAAWFVLTSVIDVIIDGSDAAGSLTGRFVSAGASLLILGGGYLLIVDSALAAATIGAILAGVVLALGVWADGKVVRQARGRPVVGARRRLRS
ncbi:hypothetical protein ACPUD8_14910 [Brevibacterium sp. FAM 25378]|uniref:hypothetical protein n=1 Tax=unclassified Brevibacterium TaxID=2614124 RepID=UPI0010922870|nr:hypothetical protein [Brevibacterium sp. S22]TGD30246.1 hypothetical protein EB835_13310 [Brevibacterium sp. S22]